MSDHVLNYLIDFISGPSLILILASWRVAKLRNLTQANYHERVDESVSNTIKEQLSIKVLTPLFAENEIFLPEGRSAYDVIDTFVPENNVELLANIYNTMAQFGAESPHYEALVQVVHALGGWG